jgi:hypothetical protein
MLDVRVFDVHPFLALIGINPAAPTFLPNAFSGGDQPPPLRCCRMCFRAGINRRPCVLARTGCRGEVYPRPSLRWIPTVFVGVGFIPARHQMDSHRFRRGEVYPRPDPRLVELHNTTNNSRRPTSRYEGKRGWF